MRTETKHKEPRPGIASTSVSGVTRKDRRIGNAGRFYVDMERQGWQVVIDADTWDIAKELAIDHYTDVTGHAPDHPPKLDRREDLSEPNESMWRLWEIQDDVERAEVAVVAVKEARDVLMRGSRRDPVEGKLRPADMAEVTGLSKARITQILGDE